MNKIPPNIKGELIDDPWYKVCCLHEDGKCKGRVEFHHGLIYAGKQVQKKFCIIPACREFHHRHANRKDIKERMDWIILNRATDTELQAISKAIDYPRYKLILNEKFGCPQL